MAKTSDIAKEQIFNKLKEIYPNGAIIDKKYYVNLSIEGEEVQISISLTAPKTKVNIAAEPSIDTFAKPKTEFNQEQIKREVEEIFDFFKL